MKCELLSPLIPDTILSSPESPGSICHRCVKAWVDDKPPTEELNPPMLELVGRLRRVPTITSTDEKTVVQLADPMKPPCKFLGPRLTTVKSRDFLGVTTTMDEHFCELLGKCTLIDCQTCPAYELRSPKKKIILRCDLSPGDIVVMTAAVRELGSRYRDKFAIDVRTPVDEIWENNPYLTPISDDNELARKIDLHYDQHDVASIDHSNQRPFHFLEGYCADLAKHLDLPELRPREFRGDIHLSEKERSWIGQVEEVFGHKGPFWILNAGGKSDFTCKQWPIENYQAVVDALAGEVQFVQVGAAEKGHLHPELRGVLDLRGKTDHRQLIRLMYHAQGVVCGVTYTMHLAAAVPSKYGDRLRPCVVVAGGREPPHWEAYPGHRFLHTIGSLKCCGFGGCWKSRITPLHDGDKEADESLCEMPQEGPDGVYSACMRLIEPLDVVRAVRQYLKFNEE